MDENEIEKKLGHKLVSEEQSLEAREYVYKYYRTVGENPYAIEWFQEKPKWLPEDVSKAWDTVVQRADDLATLGIQV